MDKDRVAGFGPVRPSLSPFFRARLAVVLGVLLILGCRPGDGEGASPEEAQSTGEVRPGDSIRQIGAVSGGLTEGRLTAGGPAPPTGAPGTEDSPSPSFLGDSASRTSAQDLESPVPRPDTTAQLLPQDSVTSTPLEARLDRLEAENDSLRATVGTLLSLLATGTVVGDLQATEGGSQGSLGDSAGVAREILAVDAERVQHWGLRIVAAVLFLLLVGLFIRAVIWVLDKLAERNAKRRLFFKRLVPIARISLWFLAILFAAMVILRIEAQGLIAAGAAVGVAVGFAAQDILKNIFGGLIVLFDQPFQVGDKISVAGTYGEVVSIGLRSTRIVTPDDNLVSVPNAQVVDGQVANANAGELNCQVVTDLFLPGWVDEARAKRIAFEAAASSKYVYLNKPIVVLVKDEFKETFLTHLKVKAYVLDPRYEFLFMSDVTERARVGFRKAGLLGPMHGARAYIDLDRFPHMTSRSGDGEVEE